MVKKIISIIAVSLLGLTSVQAAAQQAAPKPKNCSEPEFRQLDFWVGDWSLEWDNANGTKGTGTNIISNSPYGDCVITENFNGNPSIKFKGMSVSTWHKPAKLWRQTWVDDNGAYFALTGGPNADGTFTLTNTRLTDKAPHNRMVWSEITSGNLVWSWQGHKAGETAEDKKWTDQWVIRYTRNK